MPVSVTFDATTCVVVFWTNAHSTVETDADWLNLNDPSKNTISLPSVETEDGATSDKTIFRGEHWYLPGNRK